MTADVQQRIRIRATKLVVSEYRVVENEGMLTDTVAMFCCGRMSSVVGKKDIQFQYMR
jgi:hypothetical protein